MKNSYWVDLHLPDSASFHFIFPDLANSWDSQIFRVHSRCDPFLLWQLYNALYRLLAKWPAGPGVVKRCCHFIWQMLENMVFFPDENSRSSLAPPAEVNTQDSTVPWGAEPSLGSCGQRNQPKECFSLFSALALCRGSYYPSFHTRSSYSCLRFRTVRHLFDFLYQEVTANGRRNYAPYQSRFYLSSSSFIVIKILSNIFTLAKLRGRQCWVDG